MIVTVNDSSIIFDLNAINLLDEFVNLDFKIIITDFVLYEVKNSDLFSKLLEFRRLNNIEIEIFNYEEMLEMYNIKNEVKSLSIPDCSVIIVAKKLNAVVLSGDKVLRNKANSLNLECHGILWVFDKLIEQEIISQSVAYERLSCLIKINNRLPMNECNLRLEKWQPFFDFTQP